MRIIVMQYNFYIENLLRKCDKLPYKIDDDIHVNCYTQIKNVLRRKLNFSGHTITVVSQKEI